MLELVAWGDFGLAVVVVGAVASVAVAVVSTGSFSRVVKSETVASVSGILSLFADDMAVESVMDERKEGGGYRAERWWERKKGRSRFFREGAKGFEKSSPVGLGNGLFFVLFFLFVYSFGIDQLHNATSTGAGRLAEAAWTVDACAAAKR